jgi:hypothetical protein
MTLKNILIFGFFTSLVLSCTTDKLKVDSSQIKVSTTFINLDSIITHSSPNQLIKFHHNFQKSIKEIYAYQLGYCLRIGEVVDTAFVNSVKQFNSDKGIIEIEKSIQTKLNNLQVYKTSILKGLKHLKYHFPKGRIPENIIFMNSLFNSNAFSTDKEIGIGLERYLGYENEMIQKLPSEPFYDWIKKAMDETYLERDAICSWILTHYVPETDGVLAEHIIYWGKVLYLTEAAFPDFDKNIILRYNKEQYKWANENEESFWKYLIDEKLLFKINGLEKANLLNEGPFTIGLPEESPDRLGQFLGWKMVRNYMSKNDVTLKELIELPYNTILQEYEIED